MIEIDDDAKSVTKLGADGNWYLIGYTWPTLDQAVGLCSLVIYRIANGIEQNNMDSPETIFSSILRAS